LPLFQYLPFRRNDYSLSHGKTEKKAFAVLGGRTLTKDNAGFFFMEEDRRNSDSQNMIYPWAELFSPGMIYRFCG